MSNAILIDRFHCALCNVVRMIGDRYHYPWFRGVRVYGTKARAELVLGDYDEPDALRSTLDIPLTDIAAGEHGEVEMHVMHAYEALHAQWKEAGARRAKSRNRARMMNGLGVVGAEGGE